MSLGVQDMFTNIAMRVVELSKYERQDSIRQSYTSYTSSNLLLSHMVPNHEQQKQQQEQEPKHQEQSHLTSPNIQLEPEKNKKKEGWCCWR